MPEDILLNEVLPLLHGLAAELPATEARLTEKLDAQDRKLNRHRRAMRLTVAALVLAAAIVVAIGAVTINNSNRANRNAQQANATAIRAACESSNEVRVNFLAYVDQVLAPAPLPPDPTPAQIASFDRRQAYVVQARSAFTPLDCH